MSVESDSILVTIESAATEPKKVTGDAGSFESYSLAELIAAHRYISGIDPNVFDAPTRGLRFSKMRPPGAV